MRLIVAIFLPFLAFFTIGRPFSGIFLPDPAAHDHRLDPRGLLGRVLARSVQDRQKDRRRLRVALRDSLAAGSARRAPYGATPTGVS